MLGDTQSIPLRFFKQPTKNSLALPFAPLKSAVAESAETMRARVEPLAVPEGLRRLPEPDPDNAGVGKAYPLIFAAVLYL